MPAQLQVNTDYFTLNNGNKIPAVGLGTWQATNEDEAYRAVLAALKNGYKHIDTAAIYGNEEQVGKAIKDSGVPREELFVTTKLWNADHKNIEEALETSLKKLGLNYVDLYLIHWPASIDKSTNKPYTDFDYVDTYRGLQKFIRTARKSEQLVFLISPKRNWKGYCLRKVSMLFLLSTKLKLTHC